MISLFSISTGVPFSDMQCEVFVIFILFFFLLPAAFLLFQILAFRHSWTEAREQAPDYHIQQRTLTFSVSYYTLCGISHIFPPSADSPDFSTPLLQHFSRWLGAGIQIVKRSWK